MASPPPLLPTAAFFGATGGCAGTALALALQNGHRATALARSPAKLTTLLLALGVPHAVLDSHLSITQGDVHDATAVARTLAGAGPLAVVVSGIGGTPQFTPNPLRPTTTDPTVCAAAMAVLTAEVGKLDGARPVVCAISTTGLARERDVPLALVPLYRVLLKHPHDDKRAMEACLVGAAARGEVGGFVLVRPTLLRGGGAVGGVRAGTEREPVRGWWVRRADVGAWIYEEVVRVGGGRWVGERVSLAY